MKNSLYSHSLTRFIQENAIEIQQLDQLTLGLYEVIKDYDLIMVGEMHGTKEPAEFIKGLYHQVSKFEDKIIIGLEIPANKLTAYLANPSEETLLTSAFFSEENVDGRNGQAWFDLIAFCHKKVNAELFFFDHPDASNRDSSMYQSVVEVKKKYPNRKIITLSGNIHNWLIPFRGQQTLGSYCAADKVNFQKDRIISINHLYQQGTMMNNTGNGLELKQVSNKASMLTKAVDYEAYFIKNFMPNQKQYTHILFTKTVNHSAIIDENN